MSIQTIGLVSTGDMGHAVGRTLREGGFTVLTALDGRSERSRGLAAKAGIEDTGDLANLIGRADLLMSVMPPSVAVDFATRCAELMTSTGTTPLFADCNAIAPATSRTIAGIIEATGADYLDAGIIGMPPGRMNPPRLYISGDRPERLETLARPDMIVRILDGGIGAASAIKMCYAALNKGAMTLETLVLVGAAQLGRRTPPGAGGCPAPDAGPHGRPGTLARGRREALVGRNAGDRQDLRRCRAHAPDP
mgnify:CR=1 FL=1